MSEVSAKDVMMLRNRTGLPMMACKSALAEAGGDITRAEDLLRKQLKGKMDTKVDRAAGEGCIAVVINNTSAAIAEVRAETDFTAKNEKFTGAVRKIASLAVGSPAGTVEPTPAMAALVDELRISTGENCSIARIQVLDRGSAPGAFGSYVHFDGKTGVVLQAEGNIPDETLRQVCMHITAAVPRPVGITANDIPADVVERERRFRVEQAMESGKPKEIAEKMVEGAMRKFFEDVALVEQPFVMDQTKKVKDVIGNAGRLVAFVRWQVGETA